MADQKPYTIRTYSTGFKVKKELYHWEGIKLPRPIMVSVAVFLVLWELFFIPATLVGFIPLMNFEFLGVDFLVIDVMGRFLVFPFVIAWAIYKAPAQGRKLTVFVASFLTRILRSKVTRLGHPVSHGRIENKQLTRLDGGKQK
ncbi:TcpE family conjugal transfer membrane protein [Thermoactinomyces sp. DSM 45892]|uniref:TcpE family conjugal transfer membrane protein n=1 Tax=Thermoactinomyces sp. DSM 45892 TaxID=1882753 RepID=UPI00089AA028|nr:TcpE family conjugal transfer membrane protein [Thermoactinomyces sp. DSM 45892]SDY87566.1 TcpE family protein [Thermoactinomyces sp. DSM 45892]